MLGARNTTARTTGGLRRTQDPARAAGGRNFALVVSARLSRVVRAGPATKTFGVHAHSRHRVASAEMATPMAGSGKGDKRS
jgi:hypothetical protein